MKTNPIQWKPIYESPVRLLGLIAITIFLTHTAAMGVFSLLPGCPMMTAIIIESVVLSSLLFPVLYLFSFRPLIVHIRQRNEAEEAMRQSEYKYRQLFENLGDAAFLTDIKSGRILDTNKGGELLLGKKRGQIMGTNMCSLFALEDQPAHQAILSRYAATDSPARYETCVQKNGNEPVPVQISGVPITLYGKRLVIELYRVRSGSSPA